MKKSALIFAALLLSACGQPAEPTEKSTSMTDAVIEYNGKFGFQSLTVFKAGAAVDYVYIKAKTL